MDILRIYPSSSKILLVGPYPPPLGGVSVHVKRLKKLLDYYRNKTDCFYTSKKSKSIIINSIKLLKLIYFRDYDIIHIHGYFRAYIFVIYLCRYFKNYAIYYTAHNSRIFENRNKISKLFIKCFIKRLDYLIVVSKHIIENFEQNKVKLPGKILVRNAFLPPPLADYNRIIETYSKDTKKFLSEKKPIIIANAWKIRFYKNIDLYGLDLCIELAIQIKKRFPQLGFLFALANSEFNSNYIAKMKETIKKAGLKQNFHIMTGQKELWPLFKRADLSIRPTLSDGDALSIREALFLKCPVIASDVVPRPNGTILFKSRNIDDLCANAMQVLQNKEFLN
jgi:glycosyltransferase involved in cell wall biosynthesis